MVGCSMWNHCRGPLFGTWKVVISSFIEAWSMSKLLASQVFCKLLLVSFGSGEEPCLACIDFIAEKNGTTALLCLLPVRAKQRSAEVRSSLLISVNSVSSKVQEWIPQRKSGCFSEIVF